MLLPIIDIQNLTKAYDKSEVHAVKSINLSILKGEKFGIFGPNGAGKTTFISMMCGILSQTSGAVNYHLNDEVLIAKAALKYIGYVPQDFAFYPELTARQNLSYFGKMYGISSQNLTKKIDYLLNKLELAHVQDKKLATYSGGMKRRINLAIGILNDPKILFLDEPTVGVDVQSKHAIFQLLNDLSAAGTTIIYTSHHLKEAEDFCDRMALIDKGEIIGLGTLGELTKHHHVDDLEELLIELTGKSLRD